LASLKSRIVCFNGWRRTLTARENCEAIFSKNITIDSFGKITILLGDNFSFPENFEKLFNDGDSELKSIFKINVIDDPFHKLNYTIEMVSFKTNLRTKRGKKIGERSIEELVGPTFLEFKDSNRYETNISKTPHAIILKMTFIDPWSISVNNLDILKIQICK